MVNTARSTVGCHTRVRGSAGWDARSARRRLLGDRITVGPQTSHGKSKKVLTLGRHGVGFDSERGFSEFYAFVDPTGRKGWNSVTLTATCRVA